MFGVLASIAFLLLLTNASGFSPIYATSVSGQYYRDLIDVNKEIPAEKNVFNVIRELPSLDIPYRPFSSFSKPNPSISEPDIPGVIYKAIVDVFFERRMSWVDIHSFQPETINELNGFFSKYGNEKINSLYYLKRRVNERWLKSCFCESAFIDSAIVGHHHISPVASALNVPVIKSPLTTLLDQEMSEKDIFSYCNKLLPYVKSNNIVDTDHFLTFG